MSRLLLLWILAAALLGTGPGSTQDLYDAPRAEELLRRSDVGGFTPPAFRARLRLRRQPPGTTHEIEVWRSGEARALVRFLDPKERGKYILRRDRELWLLAPRAKAPTRLGASYRLYGAATLDELLGTRLAKEYRVEGASEQEEAGGPLVVLELRAKSGQVSFPQVRYFVRKATERPVRAEYRLRSGKAAVAVEFLEWNDKGSPHPRRMVVHDLLHKGVRTEVEVPELDEGPVPEALFDLGDPRARRALEASGR